MPPEEYRPPAGPSVESLSNKDALVLDAQRQLLIDAGVDKGAADSIAQLDAERVGKELKSLLRNLSLVEIDPPKDPEAATQLALASKIFRAIIEGREPASEIDPAEYQVGYSSLLANLQKGQILETLRQRRLRANYGIAQTTFGSPTPRGDRIFSYEAPQRQALSNTDLDPVLAAHFSGVELDLLRDHFGTRGDNVKMPVGELAELYEMPAADVRAIISKAVERLPKSSNEPAAEAEQPAPRRRTANRRK